MKVLVVSNKQVERTYELSEEEYEEMILIDQVEDLSKWSPIQTVELDEEIVDIFQED